MSDAGPVTSGIAAESLQVRYDARLPAVLEGTTLELPEGKITALIGPNGSGKSTLLKTLARQLVPESGRVLMNGRDLSSMPARELAQKLGILFQEHATPGDTSVEELVRHGRYPYSGFLRSPSPRDLEAVEEALQLTDLTGLRHRPVSDLSGGQRQLAWIAMALAQETEYLFLDEPTTFLDLAHQFELMDLILRLNRSLGKTMVLVLHDLNLAARYADHLVVMHEGKIHASGAPAELLTAETLRRVFGVEARISRDETGHLHCLPTGRAGTV
jgi:iron complex transport system ATP-binding protein